MMRCDKGTLRMRRRRGERTGRAPGNASLQWVLASSGCVGQALCIAAIGGQ